MAINHQTYEKGPLFTIGIQKYENTRFLIDSFNLSNQTSTTFEVQLYAVMIGY